MPYMNMEAPHNDHAEQGVLGAIISNGDLFAEIDGILSSGDFYEEDSRRIYDAMKSLFYSGRKIDRVTLEQEMLSKGSDELSIKYMNILAEEFKATANCLDYARTVKDMSKRRKLASIAEHITELAYSNDSTADDIWKLAEEQIEQPDVIAEDEREWSSMQQLIDDWRERLKVGFPEGINTGLMDLDKLLGPIQKGEIVIVGARPSTGKTALAQCIAFNVAQQKPDENVLFYSLEMSEEEILERFYGIVGKVDMKRWNSFQIRLQRGEVLSDAEQTAFKAMSNKIQLAVNVLNHDKIQVKNTSLGATCSTIKRDILRRLKRNEKISLVVIDYIGLMESDDQQADKYKQRYLEVGQISRTLKLIAKSTGVPMLICSQMRRPEGTLVQRPQLHELRESGNLEQDANKVILIDWEWKREQAAKGAAATPTTEEEKRHKETSLLIVAKNRNGNVGDIAVRFIPEWTRFETMTSEYRR